MPHAEGHKVCKGGREGEGLENYEKVGLFLTDKEKRRKGGREGGEVKSAGGDEATTAIISTN